MSLPFTEITRPEQLHTAVGWLNDALRRKKRATFSLWVTGLLSAVWLAGMMTVFLGGNLALEKIQGGKELPPCAPYIMPVFNVFFAPFYRLTDAWYLQLPYSLLIIFGGPFLFALLARLLAAGLFRDRAYARIPEDRGPLAAVKAIQTYEKKVEESIWFPVLLPLFFCVPCAVLILLVFLADGSVSKLLDSSTLLGNLFIGAVAAVLLYFLMKLMLFLTGKLLEKGPSDTLSFFEMVYEYRLTIDPEERACKEQQDRRRQEHYRRQQERADELDAENFRQYIEEKQHPSTISDADVIYMQQIARGRITTDAQDGSYSKDV